MHALDTRVYLKMLTFGYIDKKKIQKILKLIEESPYPYPYSYDCYALININIDNSYLSSLEFITKKLYTHAVIMLLEVNINS